ncbi:MAG: hypothetical protein IJP62_10805 [Treponema sp.]|nr:hypothetical protein [Treponema sp.]
MKKTFTNTIISLVLLLACAVVPCTQRSFSSSPAERIVSERHEEHDFLCAREEQGTIRLLSRRTVRQQQKSFFGAELAVIQQKVAGVVLVAFFATKMVVQTVSNKFLLIIQFLQTLF